MKHLLLFFSLLVLITNAYKKDGCSNPDKFKYELIADFNNGVEDDVQIKSHITLASIRAKLATETYTITDGSAVQKEFFYLMIFLRFKSRCF